MSDLTTTVTVVILCGVCIWLYLKGLLMVSERKFVDKIVLRGVIERIDKYTWKGNTKYQFVLQGVPQIFVCDLSDPDLILAQSEDEVKIVYIPHPKLDEVIKLENLTLNARNSKQG